MIPCQEPASYRGSQTADAFLREIGHIWIGLLETAANTDDRIDALAAHFDVPVDLIRGWVDARGRTRCIARLPDGRRCAVLIGQNVDHDPRAWAGQERSCARHSL
jgi:hypothetical protein